MILVNEVLVGGQLRLKHRCVIESRSVECRVIKVDVNTAESRIFFFLLNTT